MCIILYLFVYLDAWDPSKRDIFRRLVPFLEGTKQTNLGFGKQGCVFSITRKNPSFQGVVVSFLREHSTLFVEYCMLGSKAFASNARISLKNDAFIML